MSSLSILDALNLDSLHSVFAYVDLSSLKSARLTCKTFAELGAHEFGKYLRCVSVLTHPHSFATLQDILHSRFRKSVREVNIVTPGIPPRFRLCDISRRCVHPRQDYEHIAAYLREQEDFIWEGHLLLALQTILDSLWECTALRIFTCDRLPTPVPLRSRGLPNALFSQTSSGYLSVVIRSALMALTATNLDELDLLGPRSTIWDPSSPGLRAEDIFVHQNIPAMLQKPLRALRTLRLRLGDVHLDVSRVLRVTIHLHTLDLLLSPLSRYDKVKDLLMSLPPTLKRLTIGNLESEESEFGLALQKLQTLEHLTLCQILLQTKDAWLNSLRLIYLLPRLRTFEAHDLRFAEPIASFMKKGRHRRFSDTVPTAMDVKMMDKKIASYGTEKMVGISRIYYDLETCFKSGLCSCFQQTYTSQS